MLVLSLVEMPPIQGPKDPDYHGQVPKRARYMAPDAGPAFLRWYGAAGGQLVVTDMWRSAESSLAAIKSKRGAQAPGYSGHGFGFSVDLDIEATLRARSYSYEALCQEAAMHSFHSHVRNGDEQRAESWHFNHLGPGALGYLARTDPREPATWSRAIEARIIDRYGPAMRCTPGEAQAMLCRLGYYRGEVDARIGPLSRAALGAFQRAWMLPVTEALDERTTRTLLFVAARIAIAPVVT
jgi:putative peptidoglycan binding protein